MEMNKEISIILPPHGCITELAKATGFSRTTVQRALRHNTQSKQGQIVRELFMNKYIHK